MFCDLINQHSTGLFVSYSSEKPNCMKFVIYERKMFVNSTTGANDLKTFSSSLDLRKIKPGKPFHPSSIFTSKA